MDNQRVDIIVPHRPMDRSGNSVSAVRYADLFSEIGLDANIVHASSEDRKQHDWAGIVVALNAYRTRDWVVGCPTTTKVVVVLTGTDLYQFLTTESVKTRESLQRADRIVSLNDQATRALPVQFHKNHRTIFQSARPIERRKDPHDFNSSPGALNVVVIGHLRDVKDPLRAAHASRRLDGASRIHIHQFGEAYSEDWAERANDEMRSNPRYTWHQAVDRECLTAIYASANLMVNSSRLEGGANVISEAVMADLPVLASRIDGNVGTLGDQYDGYFEVGNTRQLLSKLVSFEMDRRFAGSLGKQIQARRSRFERKVELNAWLELLSSL